MKRAFSMIGFVSAIYVIWWADRWWALPLILTGLIVRAWAQDMIGERDPVCRDEPVKREHL